MGATFVVLSGLLAAQIPTVQRLPGWSSHITDRGTSRVLAAAIGAAFVAGAFVVEQWIRTTQPRPWRRAAGLAMLMVLALGFQVDVALSERRGLEVFRSRAMTGTHATFPRAASTPLRAWDLVTRYADTPIVSVPVDSEGLRTKPPGTLLIYVGLARLADGIVATKGSPEDGTQISPYLNERHRRLVSLLIVAFPLLSSFVVVLLTLLALLLGMGRRAHWPALVYAFTAPVTLIVIRADHALYPTVMLVAWILVALAARRPDALLPALLAGVAIWAALFVSFSLLPAMLLVPAVAAVAADRARVPARATGRVLLGIASGFLAMGALAYALGYEAVERFRDATSYHARMPGVDWSPSARAFYGAANVVELLYWLGPALAACFCLAVVSGARRALLGRRMGLPADVFPGAVAMVMILTGVLGTTRTQTCRIWIFFVSAVVLAVPRVLEWLAPARSVPAFRVVLILTAAWTCILKVYQDYN